MVCQILLEKNFYHKEVFHLRRSDKIRLHCLEKFTTDRETVSKGVRKLFVKIFYASFLRCYETSSQGSFNIQCKAETCPHGQTQS